MKNKLIFIFSLFFSLTANGQEDLMKRGFDRLVAGDFKDAERIYSEVLTEYPDYSEAYLSRAYARRSLQDYDGAIADFTVAVEKGKATMYERGRWKERFQDFEGAAEDYTIYIEIGDSPCKGYHARAKVKAFLRDYEGAFEDYTSEIKEYESMAENIPIEAWTSAYIERGLILVKLEKLDEACSDFWSAKNLRDSQYISDLVYRYCR